MNIFISNKIVRIIASACAGLLILGIFWMASSYYILLRIAVFIGAVVLIITNKANPHRLLIFILIGILFNPIIPIYLYKKLLWIPIDVISACAFLLEIVEVKVPTKTKKVLKQNESIYGRDRIYRK